MSDNSSFFALVHASPMLADRMAQATAQVVTAARDLFGVQLDHEDAGGLASVRAAVLGAHELDDFMAELQALPKVRDRLPSKATTTREAPSAEAQGDGYTDPHAHHRNALRNLTEARRNGFQPPAGSEPIDPARMSDVEKIRYLMTVTDRAQKMHLSRKWGLI